MSYIVYNYLFFSTIVLLLNPNFRLPFLLPPSIILTLSSSGYLKLLARELNRCHIAVVGLTEPRLPRHGEIYVGDYLVLHSFSVMGMNGDFLSICHSSTRE